MEQCIQLLFATVVKINFVNSTIENIVADLCLNHVLKVNTSLTITCLCMLATFEALICMLND